MEITNKNIVAQLYTLRDFCKDEESFKRSMERVAAIGYGGVQVSGVGYKDAEGIRRICDENGLDIVVTHCPFTEFAGNANFEKLVEKHQIFGCKYPGIGSMPGEFFPHTFEGYASFGQKLGHIAEKLSKYDMHLVYHNHDFEFRRFNGRLAHQIIFDYAGDKLQAEIDTFWVTAGGAEPSSYIRNFKDRLDVIHFKDYGIGEDNKRQMREVGEGNENWPAILEACRYANVKYFAVEQDNCNGADPFECLETSYKNLSAMLGVK